jgi:capsular exopolysaccharide synthesis family protein
MTTEFNRTETTQIDPRLYLGILVFRWKLIVICFLYCLLAAVAYLNLVPKRYLTSAAIMIFRDPNTRIAGQSYLWEEGQTHIDLMSSESLNERVIQRLTPVWAERLGDAEALKAPVQVRRILNTGGIALELKISSRHPGYARSYLEELIQSFQAEREALKQYTSRTASRILEEQLARLDERIRLAEDEVIEFQRLNQMEYVQTKGQLELGYLQELLARQQQLSTESWMLEVQFPKLKGASAGLISNIKDLTADTGRIRAPRLRPANSDGSATAPGSTPLAEGTAADTVIAQEGDEGASGAASPGGDRNARGWQELRVKLARLEKERADLSNKLQADHPQIRALEADIRTLQGQLEFYADLEYKGAQERYQALNVQLDALEEAQRRWKNSYLLASRKGADFRHLQLAVTRLEAMHAQLFGKLNDLRVEEEIKGEHFSVTRPVRTERKPVWPDPFKILIGALVAGLGSGLGLALLIHTFDNKVQSIVDVESTVGVPFLGGIPFWMASKELSGRVRPIVGDEHRSGAAEAYRALRTNVMAALEKSGRKVVLVTSADSKEGKTLTVLNLAIMMAKAGKRVLLMDMDLRRGVLHKSFEMERSPGVIDCLRQDRPFREVVRPTNFENLWFAPAGTVDRNTSELLHMSDLAHRLSEVMEGYDYVVMDSAPVLRVTDTVVMAGIPFCTVIYVAHSNRTTKPMIRYSIDMLGDVNILGLIINSIEMNRISSLYYSYQYPNYAYYSYAYAYGYDYYLYDEKDKKSKHPSQRGMKTWIHRFRHWVRTHLLPLE